MDGDYVNEAMQMAGQTAQDAVQNLVGQLGPRFAPKPKLLSPQEQLGRFLRFSHDDLLTLRARYGEEAFNRYLVRIRQLSQEI